MTDKWKRHFLRMALLHADMSKDPSTQVGAVVVGPDREVRSVGINGFPMGITDTYHRLHDREKKLQLIVHAEMNALLLAGRVGIPMKGCTLFLAAKQGSQLIDIGLPCIRCSMSLIQAGISQIISMKHGVENINWTAGDQTVQQLLAEAGIEFSKMQLTDPVTHC